MKFNPNTPETLDAASHDRVACMSCGLCRGCRTPFLRPFVPRGWTRKYVLVGEGPGEHEDSVSGRPFTGRAGQLLQGILRGIGIGATEVAFVNAVRCRPLNNRTPTMAQVRACRPFLLQALNVMSAEIVVALGAVAIRALSNDGRLDSVTKARGRLLVIPGLTYVPRFVVATYHPAAVLHGASHLRAEIARDLRRPEDRLVEWPTDEWPRPGVEPVAIDTEYAANDELLTVAIANTRVSKATDGDFHVDQFTESDRVCVGHSLANDLQRLVAEGWSIPESWLQGKSVRDSLLLARLVDENQASYGVEDLLLSSGRRVAPWKHKTESLFRATGNMRNVPADLRVERCRLDAWASAVLAEDYYRHVPPALHDLTHRIAATIERIATAGLIIDQDKLARFGSEVEAEVSKYSDLLDRVAGVAGLPDFRPTNDHHIRALLFDRLGLPVSGRTVTGLPRVDKITLATLGNEVADLLVEFSRWDKAKKVSIDGLQKLLHPCGTLVDGRAVAYLPLNINPLGARTGRRSSNHPNCQNWPKKFRSIVVSRFPNGLIGDFDYSRLEPLLMAWYAKDADLLRVFTKGGGYIEIATGLWNRPVEKNTSQYTATKSIILGVHYNMQDAKMAADLWNKLRVRLAPSFEAHQEVVSRIRAAYLRRFPGIGRYMEARRQELLSRQQVTSAVGQVRHLPCPEGRNTPGFGHMLNQAINFPIQGLASYVTGSALIDVEAEVLRLHGVSYSEWVSALMADAKKYLTNKSSHGTIAPTIEIPTIINEVHDDVVIDFPAHDTQRYRELVIETMRVVPTLRAVVNLDIPLSVGVHIGRSWQGD